MSVDRIDVAIAALRAGRTPVEALDALLPQVADVDVAARVGALLGTAAHSEAERALLAWINAHAADDARVTSALDAIAARCTGDAARAFVAAARAAHRQVLDAAYREIIRVASGAYKSDGSKRRCPSCKSPKVHEGPNSIYEFTHMVCDACGNEEACDAYQLPEWYESSS